MKNKWIVVLLPMLAIFTPLLLAADPNLSGKWVLNKKESDDPRKKFEQSGARDSEGGEHHHGGWGGQHGDGMGGHGDGGSYYGRHEGMVDRMKALEQLTIDFTASEFKITDKDGVARTYYTDGRETETEEPRGRLRKATAKVENDQVVVTSTTQDGGESTETYYLSPDASRLYVKVRMKTIMMDDSITFVRVYDRNPPSKEN
jgi:hypothetical protein